MTNQETENGANAKKPAVANRVLGWLGYLIFPDIGEFKIEKQMPRLKITRLQNAILSR